MRVFSLLLICLGGSLAASAEDAIDVWPGMAPGETTRHVGDKLPGRENEKPPITRVVKVSSGIR